MKSTEHKRLKLAINQKLSRTVKQLHNDFSQNVMFCSNVQSDNEIAQQFTDILEAGFIHGLKDAYFDNHKRNKELPKPQFWNLICKISHKETTLQIRKLNFIRNRVGQSRAWLRLAMNESALSSYLSSLIHTPEYKTLLVRYYETHALLRDQEQCDIFLSHLQASETLRFELGCNSPILNSWTLTPLEMAGILPANPNKKLLPRNGANTSVKSQTLTPVSSLPQLQSSGSSHSRQGSLTNSIQILSSSPAFSVTSQMSGSLTSISKLTGTEINNMVEVNLGIGLSFGDSNDGIEKQVDPVLHSRHLARRKSNKRRKRQLNEDLLSSSSRCSSMSSLSSAASAAVAVPGQYEANFVRGSRRNSTSGSDVAVQDFSNTEPNSTLSVTKERFGSEDIFLGHHSSSVKSSSPSHSSFRSTRLLDARNDDCVDAAQLRTDNEDDCKSDATTLTSSRTFVANENPTLNATSHSDEFIDVYAIPPPSSPPTSVGLKTIDESFTEPPAPLSPGYGNSLLCGIGWSSDVSSNPANQVQAPSITSTPIMRPPSPSRGFDEESAVSAPPSLRRERIVPNIARKDAISQAISSTATPPANA